MLNYANSFSLSTNDKKNEFIITFKQFSPILDDSGNVVDLSKETISTVVLNHEGAEALYMLLSSSLLDKES